MPIMEIYIDVDTADRLIHAAHDLGKTPEELAESAVSETALADAKARFTNGERSPLLHVGSGS
jgi:hypothetical protein